MEKNLAVSFASGLVQPSGKSHEMFLALFDELATNCGENVLDFEIGLGFVKSEYLMKSYFQYAGCGFVKKTY